jgi:hypothetical protein
VARGLSTVWMELCDEEVGGCDGVDDVDQLHTHELWRAIVLLLIQKLDDKPAAMADAAAKDALKQKDKLWRRARSSLQR